MTIAELGNARPAPNSRLVVPNDEHTQLNQVLWNTSDPSVKTG